MPLIVTTKPQYVLLQWAADKLGLPTGMWSNDSKAVGVVDGVSIRAVMVVNGFTGEGCEVSFVSDGTKRWVTPGISVELLSAPFKVFGMPRVVCRVAADDTDTQIFALRLGFKIEGRMRAAMPDGSDAVYFSMLKSEQPLAEGV